MELWILFGVFSILLLTGVPVAFCLGIASVATVAYMGLPPVVVFQQMNSGMNAFAMMAIPFFIYAGDLMIRGGIAERLIQMAASLVGHLRGGLGQVNVVTCTLFGGISGSAVADASAVGGLMIPQMKKRGYDADYAVNVTANAAIIALLIPPSHNMIIYSLSAGGNLSIADLFTAGVVPGLLLCAALMVAAWAVAVKRGYPREPFPGFATVGRYVVLALPGVLLIGIIFGGVRSGVFTATESSCVAVVYAILVTIFVYRQLTWTAFVEATLGAVRTTAMVLLVIGTAGAFGWLMAFLEVPQATIAAMKAVSDNPITILLMINLILLVLQPDPAGARHLHGHGADDHHLHADLPAGGESLRRRSRAFRRDPDPQCRHRPQHAAGRLGAVRRLRHRPHLHRRVHAHDLAVLRCQHRRAPARHLCARPVALAAAPVPLKD